MFTFFVAMTTKPATNNTPPTSESGNALDAFNDIVSTLQNTSWIVLAIITVVVIFFEASCILVGTTPRIKK